jgi:hypothetical protein
MNTLGFDPILIGYSRTDLDRNFDQIYAFIALNSGFPTLTEYAYLGTMDVRWVDAAAGDAVTWRHSQSLLFLVWAVKLYSIV